MPLLSGNVSHKDLSGLSLSVLSASHFPKLKSHRYLLRSFCSNPFGKKWIAQILISDSNSLRYRFLPKTLPVPWVRKCQNHILWLMTCKIPHDLICETWNANSIWIHTYFVVFENYKTHIFLANKKMNIIWKDIELNARVSLHKSPLNPDPQSLLLTMLYAHPSTPFLLCTDMYTYRDTFL